MIAALLLSIRQLGDRAILRVLGLSLGLTLLLFAGAGYGFHRWMAGDDRCVAVAAVELCTRDLGGAATVVLVAVGLWLLFPAIAIGVIGAFSDTVVAAVERRHYPDAAATARAPGWARGAAIGARSALRLLGYNLLAAPFYLLLLVTGIGPLILVVAVNGFALGRDLWEMVAVRHLPPAARKAELAATRGRRLPLGLVAAVLFVVPVANLLAPVIGAAMATHLFHRRRR
jgi:CysZ protein